MIDCGGSSKQVKYKCDVECLKTQNQLIFLQKLMRDKIDYTLQAKQVKINHKIKQTQRNFKTYLKTHKQMPELFVAVYKITDLVSSIFRKQKLIVFRQFKCNSAQQHVGHQEKTNDNKQLQLKFKQPLARMIVQLNRSRKFLKAGFQRIKLQYKMMKAHESMLIEPDLEKNEQKIQQIRLFQFSKNNKDTHYDIKFNEHSFADSLTQVDVSNFVDMSLIQKNQKTDKHSKQKEDLMTKINSLQAQFHQSIRKYSDIRYNIENQILESNSLDFSGAQNSWDSRSKKNFGQVSKQEFSQRHCIQLSKDQTQNIFEDKQAIADFLQRYQELNDEADHLRAGIDCLLQIQSEKTNIRQDIISILTEAKRVLMPNPLGLSRQ